MKRKITYTKAVELATAFLGQTIEVLETMYKDSRHCQIYRIEYICGIDHRRKLIAEARTWSILFRNLFPGHLTTGWDDGIYMQPGYRAMLHNCRYIGSRIGKDTRSGIHSTANQTGTTSDNPRIDSEENAELLTVHKGEPETDKAENQLHGDATTEQGIQERSKTHTHSGD